jgi:uncharacterized protein YodC (DUF2158 family)
MEHKFKAGDLVKLKSGSEPMIIVAYVVSHAGGIMNAFDRSGGEKKFADSVETGEILCEWMYRGKKVRGTYYESSLDLINLA